MDARDIIDLMTRFLNKDFARAEAESLFGGVLSDRIPETVTLRPKADFIERVTLNLSSVGNTYHLDSISLKFKVPREIDFGILYGRYGVASEAVRLHPNQPRPYSFEAKGEHYAGQLILGVVAGSDAIRQVQTVQFRRFLP